MRKGSPRAVRPTKKQQAMLTFIKEFINEYGYSPTYREIMQGLGYKSISTVSNHIDNLIVRGYLSKRDRSARSLEPTQMPMRKVTRAKQVSEKQEKWLVNLIDHKFDYYESSAERSQSALDELYVLVGALKILGLSGPASAFTSRILYLKNLQDSQ